MWRRMAQDWGFGISEECVTEITPTLEALFEKVEQALDRDLSTTDPVLAFRASGPSEKAL